MMSDTKTGGCVCGAVTYRTTGAPERVTACHCTYCQRLTGSACAVWVSYRKQNVELTGAPRSIHEHRSDESHRWIRSEFCPRCGTTVGCTFERGGPDIYAIASGTFDDTSWIKPEKHVWTRSAQHWMIIPGDVPTFERGSQKPA